MGPQPWELRKLPWPSKGELASLASMGPQPWELRKPGDDCVRGPRAWELQWGRSLGSCGNAGDSHRQRRRLIASMGPQPWELRKLHPSVTETRHHGCFNGAAALGAAETGFANSRSTGIKMLQWGRSLGSCGNALAFHLAEIGGCIPCRESPLFRGIRTSLTLKSRVVERRSSSWKYVRICSARGIHESCISEPLAALSAVCSPPSSVVKEHVPLSED
jgi:hypothetical protein